MRDEGLKAKVAKVHADNFGVYDGMKVWEFLDFFAVAYQIPRAKRKQVIGDVLELLSTYDYAVSTSCGQTSLEAMIRDAPRDLRFAAANLVRAFRIGAGRR